MEAFGKYEVVEKIGAGGFGAVFKAYDGLLKRHVAVKICTADDEDLRRRFYREAEIAASLHHQNITTVFDFGTEGETPYLVQEFLGGDDLDRLIRRRVEMPIVHKLGCLAQIAEGLAHAHSKGIVHRDIKPGNIRLLDDGTAKIMDFGIARVLHQESALTQTGVTVGTVAYLSPEQVQGESVDHRADVYSLGVVAYELLTGRRPFEGDSVPALLFAIVSKEPAALREHTPECPEAAERIVARCLHKDPDDRYASTAELADELATLRDHMLALAVLDASDGSGAEAVATHDDLPLGAARSDAGAGGIDDLELAATPRRTGTDETAPVRTGRVMPWRPILAVAGIAALAAVGGWWWLGSDPRSVDDTGSAAIARAGDAGPAARDGESVAEADGAGTGAEGAATTIGDTGGDQPPARGSARSADGPAAGDTSSGASETGGPGSRTDAGRSSGGTGERAAEGPGETGGESGSDAAPPGETTSPPATEAPPPAPRLARVVVPKAWSDRLLVAVDDQTMRPLTRELVLELPPGPHQLRFELTTVDYSAAETVSLELEAGDRRRIEIPIPPPGVLTVQSHLGAPQGRVVVDGRDAGSSPLERRYLAPGSYRLEILAAAGASHPPIVRDLEIVAGTEVVVTFDLTGERQLRLLEKPAEP